MNDAAMFYREVAPSKNCQSLVLSFWEFAVNAALPAPIEHEVFPDGCVSIFYRRNESFRLQELFLSGLHLETIVTPVFANDVYWGMRLSPAACARVLRTDPEIFRRERRLEPDRFPTLTGNVLERLNACQNFDQAVTVYENRLRELDSEQDLADEKIIRAVRTIEETNGEIKIAELAATLGLSARQLERRFKQTSGLTPKQFARARRFRATAVNLVENEKANWALRAAEMGFTDQAHLNREFAAVAKRAPNAFTKKVKQIEHGNLLK